MTATDPTGPTGAHSGADLARHALAEYKKRTWAIPGNNPKPDKPRAVKRHGSGRDPVGLGSVLSRIVTDTEWEGGIQGGDVFDRWATLCPQYADTVQPIAYDQERGRLDLRPTSHAYAAQLRLLGGQLAKQINDKIGRPVIRSIRVLPVGAITTSGHPATSAEPQPAPETPVRTRETASPGYRQTLEAAQSNRPGPRHLTPHVQEATTRQDRLLAAAANREPEAAFTDAVAELERIRRLSGAHLDDAEKIRQAAIARKNAGDQPVRRAFDVA